MKFPTYAGDREHGKWNLFSRPGYSRRLYRKALGRVKFFHSSVSRPGAVVEENRRNARRLPEIELADDRLPDGRSGVIRTWLAGEKVIVRK